MFTVNFIDYIGCVRNVRSYT